MVAFSLELLVVLYYIYISVFLVSPTGNLSDDTTAYFSASYTVMSVRRKDQEERGIGVCSILLCIMRGREVILVDVRNNVKIILCSIATCPHAMKIADHHLEKVQRSHEHVMCTSHMQVWASGCTRKARD
jgi:GTP cyclohydrolase FolE2